MPKEKAGEKIRKWTITAATIALLTAGGYQVVDFSSEKGYAIIDKLSEKPDTTWIADSTELVDFATLGKARIGVMRLGKSKDE